MTLNKASCRIALAVLFFALALSLSGCGEKTNPKAVQYLCHDFAALNEDANPTNDTVAGIASTRLLLAGYVGETTQADLVGMWNRGICPDLPVASSNLPTDQQVEYIHKIYRALLQNQNPTDLTVSAIAGTRLLLIDIVGEPEQRDLVGQWNNET
jgi:hypothetical protein